MEHTSEPTFFAPDTVSNQSKIRRGYELVGKDDEDFLTLNYQGFVPLLTKAVQEQQEEIDSQQKEIDALKSQLQMIMDMLDNDMSDKTDSKKDNDNKKPVKLSMATQK